MSKYIIEGKKVRYTFFAWLGVSLLVFNVFLSIILTIVLGKSSLALNITLLVLSVLFLFLYLYMEDKVTLQFSYFTYSDFFMLLMLAVVLITSVSNFNDNFSYIVRFLFLILTIFFLKFDKKLPGIIFVVLIIAITVHMVCTFWFTMDKDFYLSRILPVFTPKEQRHLRYQMMINNFSTGLASNYSLNGMYMAIMVILAYSLLFYKKIDFKRVVFFGIAFVALLMTGKRGVLIFAIFALIITYFVCNKDSLPKRLGIFVPIAVSAIIIIYILSFYIEGIVATVDRFINNESKDLSTGRFDLYKIAWNEFQNRPILGVGWREYNNIVNKFYQYDGGLMDTHNVYLQLLCETGIIGFVIFVGFFISSYVKTIRLVILSKKNPDVISEKNWLLLAFSLCYQTFFLSYCMTGNPLYDVSTMYVYFFSVGFSFNISYQLKDVFIKSEDKNVSKYIRRV